MNKATLAGLTFALACTVAVPLLAQQRTDSQGNRPAVDQQNHAIAMFKAQRPGTAFFTTSDERISRVYGKAFSHGPTAKGSAESFLAQHSDVLGVTRGQLMERGPFPDGRHVQPIMYDHETQSYKFTGFYYAQHLDGVPVFRSRMMLLVRNEQDFPLVLASTDLRPLNGFALDAGQLRQADDRAAAVATQAVRARMGERAAIHSSDVVIWAGVDDIAGEPQLAVSVMAESGTVAEPATYSKMLYVVSAETGEVLYEENQVVHGGVSGNVSGISTGGTGADICHAGELTPMAYARVTSGGTVVYADENGDFDIAVNGGDPVTSRIWGKYFRVYNQAGSDAAIVQLANPPAAMNFVHNEADNSELTRAEVTAYVHSNIVRDFTLHHNPDYPVIANQTEFAVNVNLNDNCNAFYNGSSINFFTSGGGCSNTSAGGVVYHEYGHHLVNTGGSGQGAYGEGMSDCIAVLITEDPILGTGFNNNCSAGIRSADNNLQYPCSGGIHFCGQLISGCVWDTLNELKLAYPSSYMDTISALTINSILLHTGSSIDPSITIDFLTLDDDDSDIFNGTPHYAQIQAGFSAHNMAGPEIDALSFVYPQGLPESLSSGSATTFPVSVQPLAGEPAANPQATLHYRLSGEESFTSAPMQPLGGDLYEAVIPAVPCGNVAQFYVSALSSSLEIVTDPREAPTESYMRYAGDLEVAFADVFDTDLGWIVGAPDDNATSGIWVRANPNGSNSGGQQVQPSEPYTGTACYITGQHPGGSAGANDVDNGKTTLFSPAIDLTGAEDAIISYWRWYSNHAGASPYTDVFVVEISNDGENWVNVETVGPGGPEVEGGWYQHEFAISSFVAPSDQVQVRFIASDYNPQALIEAAVDAFYVNVIDCPVGCSGDFNGDSAVDVADMLQLLSAWGSCTQCIEDLTGDNEVDVADLLQLLGLWGACPE